MFWSYSVYILYICFKCPLSRFVDVNFTYDAFFYIRSFIFTYIYYVGYTILHTRYKVIM